METRPEGRKEGNQLKAKVNQNPAPKKARGTTKKVVAQKRRGNVMTQTGPSGLTKRKDKGKELSSKGTAARLVSGGVLVTWGV